MKGVRSGARHNRDLSSRRAPELRGKRRGLDAKLLQGIHRDEAMRSTPSSESGQSSAGRLEQCQKAGHAEIRADPIYGKVVSVGALSIHAKLALVVESCDGWNHARREQDQRLEAPAVERNVLNEGVVHHCANRRRLRFYRK